MGVVDVSSSATDTCAVRIVGIYATKWRDKQETFGSKDLPAVVHPLVDFYHDFAQLPRLPRVIRYQRINPVQVTFTPAVPDVEIGGVALWLFVLPSDQVVAAVRFDCLRPTFSQNPGPVA